ncbi:MAG: BMP family ABC transporter substrate-binding protein, partial [Xanthobacteraceae bacterium]
NMWAGGYPADLVQNTPFGAGADEAARKAATAAIAALKNKKPIYVGPLKDNKGNLVISKTYQNDDPDLNSMNYLLEGVQGSIT